MTALNNTRWPCTRKTWKEYRSPSPKQKSWNKNDKAASKLDVFLDSRRIPFPISFHTIFVAHDSVRRVPVINDKNPKSKTNYVSPASFQTNWEAPKSQNSHSKRRNLCHDGNAIQCPFHHFCLYSVKDQPIPLRRISLFLFASSWVGFVHESDLSRDFSPF